MSGQFAPRDFFGPWFDLSIELGTGLAGDRVLGTLQSALWESPRVIGPWLRPEDIGLTDRADATANGESLKMLYGQLTATDLPILPFALSWIREGSMSAWSGVTRPEIEYEDPARWLRLSIPVGIIAAVWDVDHTWCAASQPWLIRLCRILADVADFAYSRAPILGGVMGEEASGCWRTPTPGRLPLSTRDYPPLALIDAQAVIERGGFVIAPTMWDELGYSEPHVILESGLRYVPPNSAAGLTGA